MVPEEGSLVVRHLSFDKGGWFVVPYDVNYDEGSLNTEILHAALRVQP